MVILFLLLLGIVAAITYLASKFFENHRYLQKHNIPLIKSPHWLFGSFQELITGKVTLHLAFQRMCNSEGLTGCPIFGILWLPRPIIVIKDPELIKQVLVKDFNSFINRSKTAEKYDAIGHYNMFSVRGELWKNIRQKFSPFFTSGRLKMMFYLLDITADEMITKIDSEKQSNTTIVDLKNLFYLCTTDIIARCAFGVDAKSLENPDGEFATAARKTFEWSFRRLIELFTVASMPKIAKILNLKLAATYTSDFFMKIIPEVMDERRKSGLKRHDLIDQLIEFDDAKEFESIDILTAEAAVFFLAGYETTSTTLTLAMFEISNNRHVHDKLRSELKKKLRETNGKITYDLLMMTSDFPYLHQVVLETLRKYPILPYLERECVNSNGYSLEPFSVLKISKGMKIIVPTYPIFKDPNNFPEPEKFDPERFADWNNISTYIYFPFGVGPRNCVGERFGLMAVKLLIAKILMNYRVEHLPSTPRKIEMLENAFTNQSKVPIHLNFMKDPLM